MIISSRGIVFSQINYGETSIITRIFTETQGVQSYIVNSVRSSRSKQNPANYQPLTLLEVVAYHQPNRELHRLSDAKIVYTPQTFHQVKKSTILIFLAEILSKVLRHETDENLTLFTFIWNSIIAFDKIDNHENFHVSFLIRLTKYLGFDLSTQKELKNLSHGDPKIFNFLLEISGENYFKSYPINGDTRNKLLASLLNEYRKHIEHLTEIKSLKVLNTVFHE